MATASQIKFSHDSPAVVRVPAIDRAAADKTSSLLQHNHKEHHITFDELGRHNHIVHHTLAAFATGADADTLQKQYDLNATYQRPPPPADANIISSFNDPKIFIKNLENMDNYTNFLAFFTRELSCSSIPETLNRYVFSDTEVANNLFNRFFAGFYHPLIHLGYGIEFSQPAIVAEALAQACVHSSYMDVFFALCNEAAKTAKADTMVHLLDAIRADEKLSTSPKWDDPHKVKDGIFARAKDEMIHYAAQWQVSLPSTSASRSTQEFLEEKAAEVINATCYFTGAAQNPPKVVKMDFYYMHAVNSSIFLTVFLQQDWISEETKAKLIEYKGRLDLALYTSRRSPKLLIEEIRNYPQGDGKVRGWEEMFQEAAGKMDDGHTVKFVRALKNGETACRPFEDKDASVQVNGNVNGEVNGEKNKDKWMIRGDMWRRLAMMVLDSVRPEYGDRWARSVGFEEAWEKYPLRSSSKI